MRNADDERERGIERGRWRDGHWRRRMDRR